MHRHAMARSLRPLGLAAGLLLLAPAVSAGWQVPASSSPAAAAAAMEADGWRRLCQFRGRFVSGGLPTEATRAIPLDGYDLRFLLKVRVDELLSGELPKPWEDEVVFAVHSPSMFFRLRQGVLIEKGRHVPDGEFRFGLWRKDGAYHLELAPTAPLAAEDLKSSQRLERTDAQPGFRALSQSALALGLEGGSARGVRRSPRGITDPAGAGFGGSLRRQLQFLGDGREVLVERPER